MNSGDTMRSLSVLAVILGSSLASDVLAQRTWIVDANNGPGTNFTDLPPAVAAAQPGDHVLVRGGRYSHTIVSKGISITAIWGWVFLVNGGLMVQNIRATEQCSIKGLNSDSFTPGGLTAQDCAGSLHIELYTTTAFTNIGIDIRNCAQVTMTRCGTEWANIDSSHVVLSECGIRPFLLNSSPGVTATNSKVVLADSNVGGAPGYMDPFTCAVGPSPGPGLVATNSDILLAGGRVGVYGGSTNGGQFPCIAQTAPGVIGTGGTLTYDDTLGRAVFNSVTGTIQLFQRSVSCLNAASDWPGGVLDLRLFGPANAAEAIVASLPRFGSPLYLGPAPGWPGILVNEYAFVLLQLGTIPSTRTLQLQMPHPIPPAIYNIPVAFQAVVLPSAGPLELSTGSAAILN